MLTMPSRDGIQRLTGTRRPDPAAAAGAGRGYRRLPAAFMPEVSAPGSQLPEPTLLKGIDGQLGLTLKSRTVTVDMLVIDHIERTPVEQ
jgi:hypothetical protein